MIKAIFWNCRGVKKPVSRNHLQALVREHLPVVIYLLETRVQSFSRREVDRLVRQQWDFYVEPSVGKSGGIIVCWLNHITRLHVIHSNKQVVITEATVMGRKNWHIYAVYADKDYIKRQIIWDSISLILDAEIPALMRGDFKCILLQEDKRGGNPSIPAEAHNEFASFLANNDLLDGWNGGQHYTWCNNRKGKARMWVRLDRVCFNSTALSALPGSVVTHLTRIGSDHFPLWVQGRNLEFTPQGSTLKFEDVWLDEEASKEIVVREWQKPAHGSPPTILNHKFASTLRALKIWSQDKFGNIHAKAKYLESRIAECWYEN
ncbi:hypothetical protein AXF42_Ash002656 [Apostasia shenzhenica]|uniref:Endonuclease/exonuclease/phosphatase domain-containing protein n=1 Tax=Apostasia shenzhenica TaxID=1088818 RepID=A0A2I0A6X2_9ASPA|nr:hypothetical protein AXF42_Ash002656 [Apostasia shenzhenica]